MLPSPDRWKQMEALFYESLELPPEARSAFLRERCGADSQLREEVEALLKEVDGPMDLLQDPVREAAQGLVGNGDTQELVAGTSLGHYQVVSLLAMGGMGQVYLGEDLTLKRKVALKVLSSAYTRDESGLRRFEREAQAASALNHPNIVTIYECGQVNELQYIVSEFVDGITLREKLSQGRLELETILDIAIQIAGALEAAHAAGIIHRDIKPENVMVRNDGLVKILDFGIAKLTRAGGRQTTDARPSSISQPGMLLGTVAYMSPEQAMGTELDARTDLFSFGVVLYEMVTGSPPFAGETAAAVIEKMLTQGPIVPLHFAPDVPARLQDSINQALQKDPSLRYQHAAEMRSDLQQLKQTLQPMPPPPPSALGEEPATARPRSRVQSIATAAILLALALIAGYFAARGNTKLTDKDTVVLADFSNDTNDPVFDGTLRQGLAAQLEQSPFLNLLSDKRIAQTLSLMAQPKDTRLTGEVAREVCQRTASAATIDGSIASLGSQYVIGLKAVNCSNGDLLAEEQVTAKGKEQVLGALGEAATELRSKLGESLASVQKYDVPPDNVTTASLEALQAYNLAYREMIVKSNYVAAVPLFQRAISLDPNFAMAYARLGTTYINRDETQRTAENLRKAYELRQTVSDRERFYIDSHYDMFVTGDLEAARKTLELWAATYPRDDVPPNNLFIIYSAIGDYEKALAAQQDAFSLDPVSGVSYSNLVGAYVNVNRLADAKATAQQAQARHFETPFLHLALYQLYFLQDDAAGVEREVDTQRGVQGSEDIMLFYESNSAAYIGQFVKARELSRRAADIAQHSDDKETAAGYQALGGVREALAGNMGLARERAQAALALSTGRDVEAISAIALALADDPAQATRLADDLAKRFPADTIVQFNYLPTIRAASAIVSGNPDKAIQALAPAAPYELGGPVGQSLFFTLYPVYVRGLALLAARQGPAAAEFQKILDHPGVVVNEPIGALAHLGLGRAYNLSGERNRARVAYQDFFASWRNADPDVPILKQAKAEYAKLQ